MALTKTNTRSEERVAKAGLFPTFERFPVAASATIYGGAMVGLLDGYVVSLAAFPQAKPIGLSEGNPPGQAIPAGGTQADVNNSAGAAGALDVLVKRGVFLMENSAGDLALTEADTGEVCYFVDDETVSKDSAEGQLPVAGTFLGFDSGTSDCWVQIGVGPQERIISTGLAGEDLTGHKYGAVKLSAGGFVKCGDGERAFGILQNAPDNTEVARVCVFGPSLAKAGAGFTADSPVASDSNGLIVDAVPATLGAITTTAIATANAADQGAIYAEADVDSIATLANAIKAKFNTLITDLTNTALIGDQALGVARETAAGAATKLIFVQAAGLI